MEKAMIHVEFITQKEVVIKIETNFWKLKKREEHGYILKAGGTHVTIPFEGITAFPNYIKPKQEQDDIQELRDGMSRLRIKNKIKKKKIVKLQQKLEASQRKIAILRSYNVELEDGRKL